MRVFVLFLNHLQALEHLEAEAYYAAFLALVLDVDGLVVVVEEYLGEDPLVVVEPFCPLGDGLVLYLARLLSHQLRFLLLSVMFFTPTGPYSTFHRGWARRR